MDGRGAFYDEVGVAFDSDVETFIALKLSIDSWRWAGVPFFIRTGKNLPTTATEVLVEFKRPPQLFLRRCRRASASSEPPGVPPQAG